MPSTAPINTQWNVNTSDIAAGQVVSTSAGDLTINADGSVTDPEGYTYKNLGGRQWHVIEPDLGTNGEPITHRIWGDPHVDENNDGNSDWHFDQDALFITGSGMSLFCDTKKVGEKGEGDVTVSDKLYLNFGDTVLVMDTTQTGHVAEADMDGSAFEQMVIDNNPEAPIFVLTAAHNFIDGQTLGDLYDGGGDFVHDVNTEDLGVISERARDSIIALGRETAAEAVHNVSVRLTYDDGSVTAFSAGTLTNDDLLINLSMAQLVSLATIQILTGGSSDEDGFEPNPARMKFTANGGLSIRIPAAGGLPIAEPM